MRQLTTIAALMFAAALSLAACGSSHASHPDRSGASSSAATTTATSPASTTSTTSTASTATTAPVTHTGAGPSPAAFHRRTGVICARARTAGARFAREDKRVSTEHNRKRALADLTRVAQSELTVDNRVLKQLRAVTPPHDDAAGFYAYLEILNARIGIGDEIVDALRGGNLGAVSGLDRQTTALQARERADARRGGIAGCGRNGHS